MIQLLDENGRYFKHSIYTKYIKKISNHDLLELYKYMFLARSLDEECIYLQRCGKISLWPPLLGQEAAQIGSGKAINQKRHYVFPSYREHGVALMMGIKPRDLLKTFTGVSHSGWNPKKYNFHYYTLVLGAQALHATGYAMGIRLNKNKDLKKHLAVITYFGDGASSQGDIHESMVFASSFKAPVVFFCQNNQWAVSVPSCTQSRIPLYNRAKGYNMPGIRVDGNDILATYAVTAWALDYASNNGPILIEAYTYRIGAHTTADDPRKYRSQKEEEKWKKRDPLLRFKKYLTTSLIADKNFFLSIKKQSEKLKTDIRYSIFSYKKPNMESIFNSVYLEKHSLITEELKYLKKYESQFSDDIFKN